MQGAVAASAPVGAFISDLNPSFNAADFWKASSPAVQSRTVVKTVVKSKLHIPISHDVSAEPKPFCWLPPTSSVYLLQAAYGT